MGHVRARHEVIVVADEGQFAGFAAAVAIMFESDPATVLESPLTLIGNATQIGDRLRERRERWGYSYHVVPGDKARDFAPIIGALTGT